MRVLHAPLNVAGHVNALFEAERSLGVDSQLLLARSDVRAPEVRGTLVGEGFGPGLFPSPHNWPQRTRFLDWALDRFDVFHFNFGRSLLDFPYIPGFELRDLERLRQRGKRVVFTFQGCDARDKWDHVRQGTKAACSSCQVRGCRIKSLIRRRRLAKIRRYADHLFVLNPDLAYRLPEAELLPYAISQPVLEGFHGADRGPGDGYIRIAHAPTDRSIKGTKYLIAAVQRLKAKGLEVHLDLIEGVTRLEVVSRVAAADIAVDQLLIGWYGAFAVECMWLEKPVVCYINDSDAEGVAPPEWMGDLPFVRADVANLEQVLESLIADRQAQLRIGRRGRAFVERWHDPIRVAERAIRRYVV